MHARDTTAAPTVGLRGRFLLLALRQGHMDALLLLAVTLREHDGSTRAAAAALGVSEAAMHRLRSHPAAGAVLRAHARGRSGWRGPRTPV